jgi:hypothetical protein
MRSSRVEPRLLFAVVAIPAVAAAIEFFLNPGLHELPWTRVGLSRLVVYCIVFLGLLILRYALTPLSFFCELDIWTCFAGLTLVYGVAAVGAGPFAAVALFSVSATAVGSFVLADSWKERPGELALCMCLGEGLMGFAASLLGMTRLCYPITFLVLLSVPILLRRRWLAARASAIRGKLRSAGGSAASTAIIGALLLATGIQFLLVLKPEVGTDSLAMHLALPAYVAIHHHWAYNIREFIWALMPQTTDWCYAMAYSIGGEFAARLLNFVNLLAIFGLLYAFIRQHCSHLAALAICGLYATGPLVEVVTGSLFIENLLAALLFGSCIAFCAHFEGRGPRQFAAGWLFLGLALSCKAGALAFLPGLIVLALYSAWKRPVGWKGWAVSACGLSIGLYFYAFALLATRNPVFPFANEIFHSKLMPRDAIGGQFREALTWRTAWDITFHSSRFIEGTDGAAGFQYFLLLPVGLIVTIWRRHTATLWVVAVALSAVFLGFGQMSYLRYLYPALAVLMVPIALWLEEQDRSGGFQKWFAYGMVGAVGLLNILFQASSGWYHRDFVWNQIWNSEGAAEYVRRVAPARNMVEALNRIAPREPALFCQYDHIAGFAGPAYTTNWHTYHRNRELLNSLEAVDVLRFLDRNHIRYIASPAPAALDAWPRALPAFFDDFAQPVFSSGDWTLYCVKPEFVGREGMDLGRQVAMNPPVAGFGTYDDVDIRVVRKGFWYRDNTRSEPLYRTLTESSATGAEAAFTFRGPKITYQFARESSFGIAQVLLDGAPVGMLDQYAPVASFGQQEEVVCAAPGVHTLSIRVTGRKNAMSEGATVSLDGFYVAQ